MKPPRASATPQARLISAPWALSAHLGSSRPFQCQGPLLEPGTLRLQPASDDGASPMLGRSLCPRSRAEISAHFESLVYVAYVTRHEDKPK